MTTLKRLLKLLFIAVTYRTGILTFLLRRRLRGSAVALMYHRVLPASVLAESFSTPSIVISPESFRRHLQLLKQHMTPMTPDEFHAAIGRGQIPAGACIITFDDGWRDNLDYALPALQAEQVPALLFTATDYINTERCFWQERLGRYLFEAARHPQHSRELFLELGREDVLSLPAGTLKPAVRSIIDKLKALPQAEIDALVSRVEGLLQQWGITPPDFGPDRFLDWQQVKTLHDSGVMHIGSHCCSHTPMTKLTPAQVEEELQRSRDLIGARLGRTPLDMAYPNGNHSVAIAAQVKQQGYRMAYTTIRGHIAPGADTHRLHRVNINEDVASSDGLFLARLAGIF